MGLSHVMKTGAAIGKPHHLSKSLRSNLMCAMRVWLLSLALFAIMIGENGVQSRRQYHHHQHQSSTTATRASTAVARDAVPVLPYWSGTLPNRSFGPAAGLPLLEPSVTRTVYNSTLDDGRPNPEGLYNHGPMAIWHENTSKLFAVWYNGPFKEAHANRVVFATSRDAIQWTTPREVFPAVNSKGEENEPFASVHGRLYATASDRDWNNAHDSGHQGGLLVRRLDTEPMGAIFWLGNTKPAASNLSFPLWTEMDATTQQDMRDYASGFVNETVVSGVNGVGFNERSLYPLPAEPSAAAAKGNRVGSGPPALHSSSNLVLLLRAGSAHHHHHSSDSCNYNSSAPTGAVSMGRSGDAGPHLWASRCTLPGPAVPPISHNATSYTCRSGTGAYDFEQPNFAARVRALTAVAAMAGASQHEQDKELQLLPPPRQCNWSQPVNTTLPDAPSRTCAAPLPSGAIGLLGNQAGGSRDPLTFLVADDGLRFDRHFAVRAGAPHPKYFGPPGFQYPGFLWCRKCGTIRDTIFFIYSVSKEDIQITSAPLSALEAT